MASVEIIERDGEAVRVKVFSVKDRSVSIMSYSMWREIKEMFGIDERTVDAYDYLSGYDAHYREVGADAFYKVLED